jgi:hypothetical protein
MVKAFFYIFGSDGNTKEGKITGVPAECDGTVFMGFCKPDIRSVVQEKDWIIGISNAKLSPRKILSLIEVKDKPKLWKAIIDYPEAIWSEDNRRGQIYVNAKKIGNDYEYKYIDGAPHKEKDRKNDLSKPDTDTLIVGTSNSLILGKYGYPVDEKILSIIRKDTIVKREKVNVNAPLGKMYNRKLKRWVALSYPIPAIATLSKSDIKFSKNIVNTTRKQIEKSEGRTYQTSVDGVC